MLTRSAPKPKAKTKSKGSLVKIEDPQAIKDFKKIENEYKKLEKDHNLLQLQSISSLDKCSQQIQISLFTCCQLRR